jgi:hypothetical protein
MTVIPKSLVASAAALGAAASVSGCYVIPIDPSYPPLPGQPVVVRHPDGSTLAMAPSAQVPATLQARLYPINETAGKMGPLTATVTDYLNGHATFSLNYAGDVLQGEASRVAPSYPGFGRVHRQVYGDGRMPAGQRGIASAAGAKGSYVNCEYALADAHRGTGACLFSNGATYQMYFGG